VVSQLKRTLSLSYGFVRVLAKLKSEQRLVSPPARDTSEVSGSRGAVNSNAKRSPRDFHKVGQCRAKNYYRRYSSLRHDEGCTRNFAAVG